MDAREEIERAGKARQLLDHPLWQETWDLLEERLTQAWAHSQRGDVERREHIYLQLDAARAVRRAIEQIVLTGDMAELERSNGTTEH